MDKTKVFIGVYKENNKESLLYQKDKNTYYDLKQKKKVFLNEIEESSLITYNSIITCESRLKRNVIKLYDLDRIQKVKLSRVYIGSSYQVTEITSRQSYGRTLSDMETETEFKATLLNNDMLLISSNSYLNYSNFMNIENGEFYESIYRPEMGDIYIPTDSSRLKPVATVLGITGFVIEKGKLLEKYREYKKIKKEN